MKLKFRIETRKIKQPRIVVLRLLNENGKIVEKSLGSFSSKRNYSHILPHLDSEERYEFENFVKVIGFSKSNFKCEADRLERFIIKAAPEFKQALFSLWEKAKEYNLEYLPEYEMLSLLMQKAKLIEQQLTVFTNGEFKALAHYGIDITDLNPEKRDLKNNQKLFATVSEHAASKEALAELFNSIALQKYQKAPKFKPHHFDYLQDEIQQGNFPKWYYTIAIDALMQLGIMPDTIISPGLMVEHWLRLNKKENLKQTLNGFNQQFPHLKTDAICKNVIQASFIQHELLKMAQQSQGTVTPSIAIERWMKQWKDKHPSVSVDEMKKAFNENFPLLVDNLFFMNAIEKFLI